MANESTPATSPSPGVDLEKWVAARQRLLSAGLLLLAALFGGLLIFQLLVSFRQEAGNLPVVAWSGAMALLCLFGGLYLSFQQGQGPVPGQEGRYRLLVLGMGGLAGLA